MSLPAAQLVGRTAELGSLDQALVELARGRRGALDVVGEPGMGKTSSARRTPRSRRSWWCPKTVETHVRNLFHKLGVSSRVEVARAVERADRR